MRVPRAALMLIASLGFVPEVSGQVSRPKTDLDRVLTTSDSEVRLRIMNVGGDTLQGWLFSYRNDVLVLSDREGDERTIRTHEIAEVWRGGCSKARGAAAGGVAGTLLGVFLGFMLVEINSSIGFASSPDPTNEDYARGVLVGGVIGGFAGAAIGIAVAPGEWKHCYP